MKKIPLTQGKFAIVDDADFEWLNKCKWCAQKSHRRYYAIRSIKIGNTNHTIKMHRVIMNLKVGDKQQVDHINHNGLDNQKYNLRLCNQAQNAMNQEIQKRYSKTSKYRGVHLFACKVKGKTYKYWRASLRVNQKLIHLGQFKTEELAAKAYNEAAIKYFGDFAFTNAITTENTKELANVK